MEVNIPPQTRGSLIKAKSVNLNLDKGLVNKSA